MFGLWGAVGQQSIMEQFLGRQVRTDQSKDEESKVELTVQKLRLDVQRPEGRNPKWNSSWPER